MGELILNRVEFLRKIYPMRKIIIIASGIFVLLSFVIFLESAFVIISGDRVSNPVFIVFSYLLAWVLVALGLIGIKLGLLSYTVGHHRMLSDSRPSISPQWNVTNDPETELMQFTLPGSIQTTTVDVLYPPPPPRYSSLSSPTLQPPPTQAHSAPVRRPATSPISPPPPYIPTSGLPIR